MARGWESKEIESQIEAAESRRSAVKPTELTEAERIVQREREHLESSRIRVLHDLETCRHPRHREQLESAIAFLDTRLAALDGNLQR